MKIVDRIMSYLLILMIGIGIGMFWRMKQIEPQLTSLVEGLKEERKEMRGNMISFETRLKILERRIHK